MTATLIPPTTKATTARARIDSMAADLWADSDARLTKLFSQPLKPFPKNKINLSELFEGWTMVAFDGEWYSVLPPEHLELPNCLVIDVEASKDGEVSLNPITNQPEYEPRLCVATDNETGWYVWKGTAGDRLIQMPADTLLVTWNGGAHDSKYMSAEYEGDALPIIHLDIMALLNIQRGVPDALRAQHTRYTQNINTGKSAPQWFFNSCELSLEAATRTVLAEPIRKGIDANDPDAPHSWLDYNAQDVEQTFKLGQRLYTTMKARHFGSMATFVGMAATMGMSTYVGSSEQWGGFVEHLNNSVLAVPEHSKLRRAWQTHYKAEFEGLYLNDGAAKMCINPAGDVITRWPSSPIWANRYHDLNGTQASAENGGCAVHLEIPAAGELKKCAGKEIFDSSPLLGVKVPLSIADDSTPKQEQLQSEFMAASINIDLLHSAMVIIYSEIFDRGLDARVLCFSKHSDRITITILGEDNDAAKLAGIVSTAEDLLTDFINQGHEDLTPF